MFDGDGDVDGGENGTGGGTVAGGDAGTGAGDVVVEGAGEGGAGAGDVLALTTVIGLLVAVRLKLSFTKYRNS